MAKSVASTATRSWRLRKIYGPSFASEHAETDKLSEVLSDMNEQSLSQLVRDHDAGNLEDKVRTAALD